jgi:hypothetical protein
MLDKKFRTISSFFFCNASFSFDIFQNIGEIAVLSGLTEKEENMVESFGILFIQLNFDNLMFVYYTTFTKWIYNEMVSLK